MKANKTTKRFWNLVNRSVKGCWLWKNRKSDYATFYLNGKTQQAHRVSWEFSYGPIPKDLWVLHKCDVPLCVRPDHLFLGTALDNARDRDTKGRRAIGKKRNLLPEKMARRGDINGSRTCPESRPRGENHKRARLTESDVLSIRQRYATGTVLQRELAEEHGMTQAQISEIILRKTWRHI